ncbi:MAG: PKD domain-containing protein, partial [Euryarchaeota archaeon]|nr:PKD domain-containing protein [Euryarchaeota archaeon]
MTRTAPFATLASALAILLLAAPAQAHPAVADYTPHGPTVSDRVQFFDEGHIPEKTVTYEWRFGDGSVSRERAPIGGFRTAGDHWANLTVTHADGERSSDNVSFLVQGARAPPVAIPQWARIVTPIGVGILLALLSLLVISRGQPTIYNRVFFALYMTSAVKSITDGLYSLFKFDVDATALDATLAINQVMGYLLLSLFFWFVLVFPRPVWGWLKSGGRGSLTLLLAAPFLVNLVVPVFENVSYNLYAALMGLVALGLLVYHAWETDSKEERHRIQLLSATFFLLVFSTIAITGIQVLGQGAFANGDRVTGHYYYALAEDFGLVVAPLLEVVGSFVLMYAILRYQLMGVDVIVKRVTRGAMFAIIIGSTFVTVGNTIEFFLEEKLFQGKVPLGFLVAGFAAALAMLPVQKATEKIAN